MGINLDSTSGYSPEMRALCFYGMDCNSMICGDNRLDFSGLLVGVASE